jgi:Na+-transporting NADH:ubiquinone oxidoreductase subunit NqrC
MKKIILALLIATTISCNVIKNFRKEKSKEETKTDQQTKVDSVAEVEREKEIVSTFTTDTKTEFFDLSEVTIFEVMNDSGVVKERTTTTKTNIKGNVIAKGKEDKKETTAESKKIDLSKVDKSKESKSKSELVKVKEVKKTPSFNFLLWIILIITGVVFALVAIWKVKKNNFTQFFK